MSKIKLFLLPHAGGSAFYFQPWKKYFTNGPIELIPLDYPGHGKRLGEPLCHNLHDLVNDVTHQISLQKQDAPYALFGHSIGCFVAFELAHRVLSEGKASPCHIFFSAHIPLHLGLKTCFSQERLQKFLSDNQVEEATLLNIVPHALMENKVCFARKDIEAVRATYPKIYKPLMHKCYVPFEASDAELIDKILEIEQTNIKDILNNKELRELFLPIIRADGEIYGKYKYSPRVAILRTNITGLYGTGEEDITAVDMAKWRELTEGTCTIYSFSGGHFYIDQNIEAITRIVQNTLTQH